MPEYCEPVSERTKRIGSLITSQCLQGRIGRRDLESVLSLPSAVSKYRDTKINLQTEVQQCDGIIQEVRWPTECQVIQEKIRHIEYIPPTPEPFYNITGKEPKPKPVGDESGIVIFRYCPMSSTNYFSRSCLGGSAVLESNAILPNIPDTTGNEEVLQLTCDNEDLRFESRFESGNLGKVIKITDTYYQLHLRKDLYTQRHMQWYYFRISNTKSRTMYRLSIVNFCKEDSLYNEGLKPLLYSTKDANMHAVGWRRCGDNISYYKNDSSDEEKNRHTLTFNISFPHDQDTVYLAHCYPYTYTDLQEYLLKIVGDPVKTKFTKLRLLCRTLAGNNVYYLTVTAPTFNDDVRKKKGVVITARVHPGETPSSWIMKGIIDFLTGESNQARELRERFIFKLVPMLNPDGVIVGNNRCSLSGKDLNRQYRTVMRESYPSVWHTKLMIRRLLEECGIAMYCDLHAHSRKHNVFVYGCESKRANCNGKLSEQVFPLMLHKNAADKFSFESCKFHIEKGKEGTGRVVIWLMGVQNSYTMEASMGGSKIGSRAATHFSTQDYEQVGKAFCETLLDFSDEDPTKERLRNKIIVRLIKEGSSADEPTNINLTDYSSDEGDTSDSSADEVKLELMEEIDRSPTELVSQYLCVPPPPSPLLLKSRVISNKILKSKSRSATNRTKKNTYNRRAVLDLPTTDPGSDLCDLTDSADEAFVNRSSRSVRRRRKFRSSYKEKSTTSSEMEEKGRKDYRSEFLPLPLIARPRSLSFSEELISPVIPPKSRGLRPRFQQLPRVLRNLSPRSEDVRIKLTSLNQHVWTGTSIDIDKDDFGDSSYVKSPLSWGISTLTMTSPMDSEALLKSCSRKLASLNYIQKMDVRQTKKKLQKKDKVTNITSTNCELIEDPQKPLRKKRIRLKRQRGIISVNPENKIPDTEPFSDKTDSLKLFGVAKLPKSATKQKSDPKRKFRKGGIVAVVATNAATKLKSSRPVVDTYADSSSPEDTFVSIKPKTTRRKKKSSTAKKYISSEPKNY